MGAAPSKTKISSYRQSDTNFELMHYDNNYMSPSQRCILKKREFIICDSENRAYSKPLCETCTEHLKEPTMPDMPKHAKDIIYYSHGYLVFLSFPKEERCKDCERVIHPKILLDGEPILRYIQPLNWKVLAIDFKLSKPTDMYILDVANFGHIFCIASAERVFYLPDTRIIMPKLPGWHAMIKLENGGFFGCFDGGKDLVIVANSGQILKHKELHIVGVVDNSYWSFYKPNIVNVYEDENDSITIYDYNEEAKYTRKFQTGKRTKPAR